MRASMAISSASSRDTPAVTTDGIPGSVARPAGLVRLETNGALTEAIAMYRSSGYAEVAPFSDEPYAHHWFEKQLG